MKHTIPALTFIACAVLQAAAQDGNFIDLTNPPPQRPRTSGGGSSSIGGVLHGPPVAREIPVRVALVSLDAESYRYGEVVVWEIDVENILDEPIVIPWSIDFDRVRPNSPEYPAGYVSSSITLQILDGVRIGARTMAASNLYPESFKTLMPGESVRIRGSSGLRISNASFEDQFLPQLPLTVEVLGHYRLSNPPTNDRYDPAVSETGIEIEITN